MSTCEIPGTERIDFCQTPIFWVIFKYENGALKRHIDAQRHPKHKGTQILLPPKSQCRYEGGQLVIQDTEIILPHETQWTYVYMPLGTRHEVKATIGTRISFGRAIYGSQDFKYEHEKDENVVAQY